MNTSRKFIILFLATAFHVTSLHAIVVTYKKQLNQSANFQTKKEAFQKQTPSDVALLFINKYVKDLNNSKGGKTPYDLIRSSKLVTENFKKRLKKMLDDANREDPEMGLGFDPILNGQDYPEKGFELKNFDKKKNLVIVQGIDWPEFTVTIKMVNIKGKWLVDGCGVVNIKR